MLLSPRSLVLLLSCITSLFFFTQLVSSRPSDITFFSPSSSSSSSLSRSLLYPRAPKPKPHRRVVVRHYTLSVSSSTVFQSCDPFTSTPLINSSSPGPTLRARSGEILQVRVHNSLAPSSHSNLTMHFHGLSMKMRPVMDGTTMVSQWPIQPGQYFDYKIGLTAEDKGSYFYHSHVGVQAMTAYGALIIEDPREEEFFDPVSDVGVEIEYVHVNGEDGLEPNGKSGAKSPYRWDEDRVLAVSDYFSYSSPERIENQLNSDPFIWPGSATKLLLNGKTSPTNISTNIEPACNGTRASLIGVSCSTVPPSCTSSPGYPTIELDYDKTYRLRFVGATSLMYVSLGIMKPGANGALEEMTLIEADGSYLDPLQVDRVELTSGQRYSTLYRTKTRKEVEKDNTAGVYWMRAESRWRAGPSMWIKLAYPSPGSAQKAGRSQPQLPPAQFDPATGKELQVLPKETFGWVTSQFTPLSRTGGASWWYSTPMPRDSEVTRTVVIDTQQVKFFSSGKGVKWAENGRFFNESQPSASNPTPYLVRTFLGDISFPSPDELSSPVYNPTSYPSTPTDSARMQGLVEDSAAEQEAARGRKWGQGYDERLNMYFAEEGEVVDIVLVNKPSELSKNVEIHPWHMHSHKHWTRTIQPGTFSFSRLTQLYSSPSSSREWTSPIQRDTTVVYASPGAAFLNSTVPDPTTNDGGFAVLRYKVDPSNAGVFLLHCHLAFHLEMGMATVWTMAPHRLADKAGGYWPQKSASNSGPKGVEGVEGVEGLSMDYLRFGMSVGAV